MMKPGALNTGLKAPSAVDLRSNPQLTPSYPAGLQLPPGSKGGGKGRQPRTLRSTNAHQSDPKKPAKPQSELTVANARLRDSGSKTMEIKGWGRIISTKEGVSKEMRDGYLADLERHRTSMTEATEALQHATMPGVKNEDGRVASLTTTLTKALEDYNAFVRQVKVIFELRLLI